MGVQRSVVLPGGVLAVVPRKDRGSLDVQIRFRVDEALARRINAVCEETGRIQSDVVRLLLEAGLELHDQEKKTKK